LKGENKIVYLKHEKIINFISIGIISI
jgi:hypothetical protein